jgi:hypothetical protein
VIPSTKPKPTSQRVRSPILHTAAAAGSEDTTTTTTTIYWMERPAKIWFLLLFFFLFSFVQKLKDGVDLI